MGKEGILEDTNSETEVRRYSLVLTSGTKSVLIYIANMNKNGWKFSGVLAWVIFLVILDESQVRNAFLCEFFAYCFAH